MNVAGERILIFGDSLSHPGPDAGPTIIDVQSGDRSRTAPLLSAAPGAVLAAQLLEDGHAQAVRIDARVGRSARSFFTNEDANGLIASDVAFRPTKIVIMLGTNDIDNGVTPDAIARTVQDLTRIQQAYRKLGNVEIFAIGPPTYLNAHYTQGAPIILDALRTVFGADHTIDARPLTLATPRAGDGVHFTQTSAAAAGRTLAAALAATPEPPGLTTTSTGIQIAIGALGVVSLAVLSWLVLRAAKRAALAPGFARRRRRDLGIADERLITRIAQALSYDVPKKEIHDQLVDEGYSEEDIYLAYKAAKMHLRYMDEPPPEWVKPDPSAGFGAVEIRKIRAGEVEERVHHARGTKRVRTGAASYGVFIDGTQVADILGERSGYRGRTRWEIITTGYADSRLNYRVLHRADTLQAAKDWAVENEQTFIEHGRKNLTAWRYRRERLAT